MTNFAKQGKAQLLIDAALYCLVAKPHRGAQTTATIGNKRSIKDLLESLGIPHVEIDAIIVNGQPVDYSYAIQDNDRVQVLAPRLPIDVAQPTALRRETLPEIKFVADVHLGRLRSHLRLLGFDTASDNATDDARLAEQSATEGRILLTRDRNLLKRNEIVFGYFVRSTNHLLQLQEVSDRFDLPRFAKPFSRCLLCNHLLQPTSTEKVKSAVPARVRARFDSFRQCSGCGRIYWAGSHYHKLRSVVGLVIGNAGQTKR